MGSKHSKPSQLRKPTGRKSGIRTRSFSEQPSTVQSHTGKEISRSNSVCTTGSTMAEYLKVEDMKEAVMECPVCAYVFDSEERAPRLMPCCVSSICTKCLTDIIARGSGTSADCPLCRKSHGDIKGVADFPLERVMLKMVEYLKVQKGQKFPCTDCPEKSHAVSRCKDCGLFMCNECLSAHKRNGITREHTTISFDELRSQSIQNFNSGHHCPQHKLNPLQFYCRKCDKVICVSCTVVDHKENDGHTISSVDQICEERASQADAFLDRLDKKIRKLGKEVENIRKKRKNLTTSKISAKKQVEATFDSLIEELQQRKELIMTEVDTRFEVHDSAMERRLTQTEAMISRVVSASEYIQHVRSTADEIESIQLFSRVKLVLDGIVDEEPVADDWVRKGLGFDPTMATDIRELIQNTGMVKTVTYMKDQVNSEAQTLYIQPATVQKPPRLGTSLTLCGHATDPRQPFDIDSGQGDRVIILEDVPVDGRSAAIHCPKLRFDKICISRECSTTADGSLINRKLHRTLPGSETGCRLKIGRRALVSTSFSGKHPQLWQTTLKAKIKAASADNSMIFEAALTPKPVDAVIAQPSGFSLNISDCFNHKQLCLKLRQNGELMADVPAILNKPEEERVLELGFLLDGNKKQLHVFDMTDVKSLISLEDVDTADPLWMVFYVDTPDESEMEVNLVSGVDVKVTDKLVKLLKSVC